MKVFFIYSGDKKETTKIEKKIQPGDSLNAFIEKNKLPKHALKKIYKFNVNLNSDELYPYLNSDHLIDFFSKVSSPNLLSFDNKNNFFQKHNEIYLFFKYCDRKTKKIVLSTSNKNTRKKRT